MSILINSLYYLKWTDYVNSNNSLRVVCGWSLTEYWYVSLMYRSLAMTSLSGKVQQQSSLTIHMCMSNEIVSWIVQYHAMSRKGNLHLYAVIIQIKILERISLKPKQYEITFIPKVQKIWPNKWGRSLTLHIEAIFDFLFCYLKSYSGFYFRSLRLCLRFKLIQMRRVGFTCPDSKWREIMLRTDWLLMWQKTKGL